MVRGNWERRAELGNIRRQRARDRKKERRENGKIPNGEAVLRLLKQDSNLITITSNAKIEIWLDPIEGSCYLVCKSWFRYDNCTAKKV